MTLPDTLLLLAIALAVAGWAMFVWASLERSKWKQAYGEQHDLARGFRDEAHAWHVRERRRREADEEPPFLLVGTEIINGLGERIAQPFDKEHIENL